MSSERIFVYGTRWCGDCRRARRWLDTHQIPYDWIDIDQNREAEQYVKRANNGNRSVPTIVFRDGSILVEPSNAELAAKLQIAYLAADSE